MIVRWRLLNSDLNLTDALVLINGIHGDILQAFELFFDSYDFEIFNLVKFVVNVDYLLGVFDYDHCPDKICNFVVMHSLCAIVHFPYYEY